MYTMKNIKLGRQTDGILLERNSISGFIYHISYTFSLQQQKFVLR